MQTVLMNVRFEGNNGHEADVTRCLLLDPKRTLFALTAEAEAKRPDASLMNCLLGRSVIGSCGGDAVASRADNTKTQGSGGQV